MRMLRPAIAGAVTLGLALTLTAAPARAADCTLTDSRTRTKVCLRPSWAKAKKPSITVKANGKYAATYNKGKSKTYRLQVDVKGFGTKGNCRVRDKNESSRAGKTVTTTAPWVKVPCASLALSIKTAKSPFAPIPIDDDLPLVVASVTQIKTAKGKIISSKPVVITINSPYNPPK
ncbi:MAG: hypothetical protein FWD59_01735 [Micrococcales bacterium]|nr:hypothetical protein [Micrococcales bacterium]